jgi:opacity protein-like surface antigen
VDQEESQMLRRAILLGAGLAWLSVSAALAQEEGEVQDFGREGTYLAVSFVFAVEDFDDAGTSDVDPSPGFHARLGQRVNRHLGVEAQWEWIDGFEIDDFLDLELHQLTVNLRAFLTTGRIQPFLTAGIGFIHAELESGGLELADDDAFLTRGGGGLEIYLTSSFTVNLGAEYVFPTDDILGLDYRYISTSAGLQYRF